MLSFGGTVTVKRQSMDVRTWCHPCTIPKSAASKLDVNSGGQRSTLDLQRQSGDQNIESHWRTKARSAVSSWVDMLSFIYGNLWQFHAAHWGAGAMCWCFWIRGTIWKNTCFRSGASKYWKRDAINKSIRHINMYLDRHTYSLKVLLCIVASHVHKHHNKHPRVSLKSARPTGLVELRKLKAGSMMIVHIIASCANPQAIACKSTVFFYVFTATLVGANLTMLTSQVLPPARCFWRSTNCFFFPKLFTTILVEILWISLLKRLWPTVDEMVHIPAKPLQIHFVNKIFVQVGRLSS